jgi:hypothetical protein
VLLKPAILPLAPSGDPRSPVPGNVALVASAKCTHDRHHIGQISRWLRAREPDPGRPSARGRRRRS